MKVGSGGRFGFYAEERDGQRDPVVGAEFDALLSDEDLEVGDGAATFIARLDAIGAGRQPPDPPVDETGELFGWTEGKAAMIYTVERDRRGRIQRAIALRFAQSASAQLRASDIQVARERLDRARKA